MYLVIGLGFGDEGKGTTVDTLARRVISGQDGAHKGRVTVVRFNGGPQAAHHVLDGSGRSHCFAQFGSASLVAGTQTLLSSYMLVEPAALLREAQALLSIGVPAPLRRLHIDARCVVVTPFHKLLNRMQEVARREGRHGSCGLGVGQAFLDSHNRSIPSLRMGDARDSSTLIRKLRFLQLVKIDQAEQLVDANPDLLELRTHLAELKRLDWSSRLIELYAVLLREMAGVCESEEVLRRACLEPEQRVLFEGAQGVLLDAEYGFWPYVTPSRTTFLNAEALLLSAFEGRPRPKPVRLGVLRAYATRHGPGPFVTHDRELEARLPESHNVPNPWQGPMRVGWFDVVAARYAIAAAGGVDAICLSNLDRLDGLFALRVAVGYKTCTPTDGPSILESIPISSPPTRESQAALTQTLTMAQPIYREFMGWPSALEDSGTALCSQALDFIRFLESAEGLGVPIAMVSVGPTAADKLFFMNL